MLVSELIELSIWAGRYYIQSQDNNATIEQMKLAGFPTIIGESVHFEEWTHPTIPAPSTSTILAMDAGTLRSFAREWQANEKMSSPHFCAIKCVLIDLFPEREQDILNALMSACVNE